MADEFSRTQDEWDDIWLGAALYFGRKMSKDPSTKVGALLIHDNDLVTIGVNGFPSQYPDDPKVWANRPVKYENVIHAEINACSKPRSTKGPFTLYCSFHPCDQCVGVMKNSGVIRAVFPDPTEDDRVRWGPSFDKAITKMDLLGIQYRKIR